MMLARAVLVMAGAVWAGFAAAQAASAPADAAARGGMVDAAQAHVDFIEHCAGCHGVGGHSAPAHLPELAGRVG